MRMKLKITADNLYHYLLILLLINNWWGDLRVFIGFYQIFKPFVLGLAFFLSLLLLFREKHANTELIIIFFLIISGLYTTYVTDSKWTLYSMVLIAFAKNVNIEKTIRIVYECMSVFVSIAVSIFLFQYFFAPAYLNTFEDITAGVTKYSMTFVGANEAARYWIFWFVLFIYANAGKTIAVGKKCMILLLTILFWVCTHSDALILVPFISLLKCLENKKNIRHMIVKYSGYSFALIWISSLVLLYFNDSIIYHALNEFSTGRLLRGLLSFQAYDITMFGQSSVEFGYWIDWNENYALRVVVDNAYYMTMLKYGTIYLLIIAYLFIKAGTRMDYKSACCIILYSAFAFAENNILSPTAIFPVIIAANLSWKTRKENYLLYEYIKPA